MNADRTVALEAIVYGNDARISPADRIRALEMLDRLGTEHDVPPAMLAFAAQVSELSGDALDAELAGMFNPGYQPPPDGGGEPMIEQRGFEVIPSARVESSN